MLDAGLPVAQAIRSLSEQTDNLVVQRSLIVVVADLENGYKLSDALEKHPKIFNHIFITIVAAGESSGQLDVALTMLADELERDYGFRSRVLGSLLYPAFIIVAMIIVGIIMVTRIVPALEQVFKESSAELPWTTKTVVAITNSLIHGWYWYLLVLAALIYTFARYLSTPNGQRGFANFLMKLPIAGPLLKNLEMSRFTRILSILMRAGVPIITAIDSVAAVMDSITYRELLTTAARNVERGSPLSQSLVKSDQFPNTVTEMIAAGEKTGKLEEVLSKLADFYEQQTNQSSRNVATLVEPVVFVIVGLGVAFLVFSIIVPIYNLASVIK